MNQMEKPGARRSWAFAAALTTALLLALALFLAPGKVSAYTLHTPIYINGDANFTTGNGVTGGDGSPSNLYVISGWDIDSSTTDGITVRTSTAHFVIRDSYVHSSAAAHNAVTLFRVDGGRVEGLVSVANQYGVMIDSSSNVTVAAGNVSAGVYGIGIVQSVNVGLSGNNVSSNFRDAVAVEASSNVSIIDNEIFRNGGGVILQNSTTAVVSRNNISWSNGYGVYAHLFGTPSNAEITANNISRNNYGVYLDGATSVRVYHNNFLGNTVQAFDSRGAENSWDNGCPSGGNFWSDYSGIDAVDCRTGLAGSDGFGDAPYTIDADSSDGHPLMVPWLGNRTNSPPSVFLQNPTAGLDLTGGSILGISWSMIDDSSLQLSVWINLSLNGGADGYPYPMFSGKLGVGGYVRSWTLPLMDTDAAEVLITAMDDSGLKSTDRSGLFTIDSSPPFIYASTPTDGQTGVDYYGDIQIIFNETVNRTSAQAAFSIAPVVASGSFAWSTTPQRRDVLNVSHSPFAPATRYTVTLSTSLKDASEPGNHPPAALTFSFTTKPRPVILPPVSRASAVNSATVGEAVMLNGSASTGNITWYNWTIFDEHGGSIATLRGVFVNYTFVAAGRYHVVLNVTDGATNLSDVDTLEIDIVEPTVTAGNPYVIPVVVIITATIVAFALIGGIEAWRVPFMTAVLGLAWRRKDEGKEESETRGMIRGYIQLNPGDTYTDIKRNLDLSSGSLTWHLMKLEKEEVIKSAVRGTRKLYYPAKMPIPKENGGQLHEIERRLLSAVKADPGKPIKVLAEELGVSSQLALYHLRKMDQKGLISMERRGLSLRVYPPPKKDA